MDQLIRKRTGQFSHLATHAEKGARKLSEVSRSSRGPNDGSAETVGRVKRDSPSLELFDQACVRSTQEDVGSKVWRTPGFEVMKQNVLGAADRRRIGNVKKIHGKSTCAITKRSVRADDATTASAAPALRLW